MNEQNENKEEAMRITLIIENILSGRYILKTTKHCLSAQQLTMVYMCLLISTTDRT